MSASIHDDRPSLLRDRSFWGLNLTQFLGAFNDNMFKQLVMLLCIDKASPGQSDLQGLAQILFAVPFICISGYAGYLSDRYSKRTIIILCKIAEVAIVSLGMTGFYFASLPFLLGVIFLMGVHSSFFGPSKYGILPEMLRGTDLPRANGSILMATFLSIIFGFAAAGFAKEKYNQTLWMASLPCLVVAIAGLATSLFIRRTPVQPDLRFDSSSIAIAPDTRRLLWSQPNLLGVLLASSVFWFLGGTVLSSINALSKQQFGLGDALTGVLAATTGFGIAIGCILAGVLSKNRVRGWIVRCGAWGITISLMALALPGPGWNDMREEIRAAKAQAQMKEKESPTTESAEPSARINVGSDEKPSSDQKLNRHSGGQGTLFNQKGTLLGPIGSGFALVCVGLFSGFFTVPLQVYLQTATPAEQKGRIIGVLNLFNWIGIAGAGVVYQVGQVLLINWLELPYATLFAFASVLMFPVALFYRPPDARIAT